VLPPVLLPMLPPVRPPVLSPPVTVTKLLLPQRAEASVASSHGASRMPSSCKHVWSRTRSVVSVQEQGRHHRCGLARGRRSPGCCRQSGVHRHRTRGHLQPLLVGKGMQRPVLEGSPSPGKRGRNRRPSRSKTRDVRAVRAGQRSRGRALCVLCTPTCGMTTNERVSKGGERARVAV
jgi:hypothetical protein